MSVGFLSDSQQIVLIGCYLVAGKVGKKTQKNKPHQFIIKEAAQILWNTGAFCEANRTSRQHRNTGTHDFDAFNKGKMVQGLQH